MKIYIMTDLEGVSGVVNRSQVFSNESGYEKAREWLTQDVNAAVEGALQGGATEVLVTDGHGGNGAVNFLYDKLHAGARYIQGTPWKTHLQSLDESFDGLLQIGMHAMAGTPGAILEHTMSSLAWVEMLINGKPTGEIGLFAAMAGEFGVPFAMVSGDDKACLEARGINPQVECAEVKKGITRHCANLLPMPVVHELITEKACAAVKKVKTIAPYKIEPPIEIQVEYFRNDLVDGIREREGVTKIGPRRVAFTGNSVREAFYRVMGG